MATQRKKAGRKAPEKKSAAPAKRKQAGHVTLRGRFPAGMTVNLVAEPGVADVDVTTLPVIASRKVRADGSVSFDDLAPGGEFVVVAPELGGRRAQVVARGAKAPESSLVPRPDIAPVEEEPQTPVEDVPGRVHTGQRSTRSTATRGERFAGGAVVGPVESIGVTGAPLGKGEKHNAVTGPRVEDAAAKAKLVSDTPTGEAVTVAEFEARQEHLATTGLLPPGEGVGRPVDDEGNVVA